MGFKRCPGSSAFTQPKIELVRCPSCGADVELWSDEAEGKCTGCGRPICRTHTQSCIDWCKYANECLGDEAFKRYQDMRTRLRKDSLLKAAEDHLADPAARALTAARVRLAEQILSKEASADPNVVMAATALYGLGAPRPDSQPAGTAADQPSPAVEILQTMGYPQGFVKEVAGILRRSPEPNPADINARIVHDAELLATGMSGLQAKAPGERLEEALKDLLTESARAVARQELAAIRAGKAQP